MLVGQARLRSPIECGYVAVREGVIVVIGIGANTRVVVDDPGADHKSLRLTGLRPEKVLDRESEEVAPALAHALALRRVQRVALARAADEAVGQAMRVFMEDYIGIQDPVQSRA